MKALDRLLQRWRIRMALRHVPHGAVVCDIGSYDGALFAIGRERISSGVAIDPDLQPLLPARASVVGVVGLFPDALPDDRRFDAITALAVLEHIPPEAIRRLAESVHERLQPGGRFIVTSPMPLVDTILLVLTRLKLVHGMALEQHYGLDPRQLPALIAPSGLQLERAIHFQLGLNRLFVFRKAAH